MGKRNRRRQSRAHLHRGQNPTSTPPSSIDATSNEMHDHHHLPTSNPLRPVVAAICNDIPVDTPALDVFVTKNEHMLDDVNQLQKNVLHQKMNNVLNMEQVCESSSTFEETFASLLDMGSRGDVPRYIFDRRQICDYHAWCVDERGNICDYPIDQVQYGERSTKDVVHRPWDACVMAEALPEIDKLNDLAFFNKYPDIPMSMWLEMINKDEFPPQNCYARAKILRDSNPEKYALVIGSLGYRQRDGSIFWEFG